MKFRFRFASVSVTFVVSVSVSAELKNCGFGRALTFKNKNAVI